MFWNSRKTYYAEEMLEHLKRFMLNYIKDNPRASDTVVPIFSNAERMIRGFRERDIQKTLQREGVPLECMVLNVIQNWAMTELKQKSGSDFILGDNHAYDLYRHVNDVKLQKGYINQKQYDDTLLSYARAGASYHGGFCTPDGLQERRRND